MAFLEIKTDRIIENIAQLSAFFKQHRKKWTLVTKILGGADDILYDILTRGDLSGVHSIADSRLSGLKKVKEINPDLITMYIKPPKLRDAGEVVRYVDISLNSSLATLIALNDAAQQQNLIHKVIIMLEMGELREGILGRDVIDFYRRAFKMEHIKVIGLGTNLGCMYGVEPTYDKLIQLSLYKELINATFGQNLSVVSGGSSIALPLIEKGKIPRGVNHFRVGEAAFMGTSPLNARRFLKLNTRNFRFHGTILELKKKQHFPDDPLGDGNIGILGEVEEALRDDIVTRCVLDFGQIDVNADDLKPVQRGISFIGTTSDMTVYRLAGVDKTYHVGDPVKFNLNYMGIARLLTSRFITRGIVTKRIKRSQK